MDASGCTAPPDSESRSLHACPDGSLLENTALAEGEAVSSCLESQCFLTSRFTHPASLLATKLTGPSVSMAQLGGVDLAKQGRDCTYCTAGSEYVPLVRGRTCLEANLRMLSGENKTEYKTGLGETWLIGCTPRMQDLMP